MPKRSLFAWLKPHDDRTPADAAVSAPVDLPGQERIGFHELFAVAATQLSEARGLSAPSSRVGAAEQYPEVGQTVSPPAVEDVLAAWAADELSTWWLKRIDRAVAEEQWRRLNESSASVFLFHFSRGEVSVAAKPVQPSSDPSTQHRVGAYLKLFRLAAKGMPCDFKATLAMGMGDKVQEVPDLPVFAFQKRRDQNSVLLPDIDFLNNDFYQDARFTDPVDYATKTDEAIFVGSTSGGHITPDVARDCSTPRLRAARFFDGSKRVGFFLPQIVQCSNDEARTILQEMPFCRPGRIGWAEQLRHRFIISIDGNGATCSRVVIALASNSILLKYDSEEMLFYFRGLIPWLHYIPITRDADVERIMDMEQWAPGRLAAIAAQGRHFRNTYLTRDAVISYTRHLLTLYRDCFTSDAPATSSQPGAADITPGSVQRSLPGGFPERMVVISHRQKTGDTLAGPDGWTGDEEGGLCIEGFSILEPKSIGTLAITYRALLADGSLSVSSRAGEYCGTRGRNLPIHGFLIEPASGATAPIRLTYEGIFRDGFRSGMVQPGDVCRAPSGAPLVTMRVLIPPAPGALSA